MTVVDSVSPKAQRFWNLPLVGVLSLVRPDGSLHATPVKAVYLIDEEHVRAAALVARRSAKARIVGSLPSRAALTEHDPHGWVSIEGPCHLSDDPRLLARAREGYQRRFAHPSTWGDVLVIVEAEHIRTGG